MLTTVSLDTNNSIGCKEKQRGAEVGSRAEARGSSPV